MGAPVTLPQSCSTVLLVSQPRTVGAACEHEVGEGAVLLSGGALRHYDLLCEAPWAKMCASVGGSLGQGDGPHAPRTGHAMMGGLLGP